MEIVQVTLDVPKEGKEVVDLVAEIIKFAKSGKPLVEAITLLDEFTSAVNGIGGVVEEIKSSGKDELAAYLVHTVWEALEAPVTTEA